MEMMMCEILKGVAVTTLSGLILAFVFFVLKEFVFPTPSIGGFWYFETETEETVYNPYRKMILGYEVALMRKGNDISGSAEKSYEITHNGQRKEYIGDERTHATIEGLIEKRVLSRDRVSIQLLEKGKNRDSSTVFDLKIRRKWPKLKIVRKFPFIACMKLHMEGYFNSTVAKSSGSVTWQRKPF